MGDAMRGIARGGAAVGVGVICALWLSLPAAAGERTLEGTAVAPSESASAVSESTSPDDTSPETTPDSEPPDSEPPDTTPDAEPTTPDDTLVGSGDPDGDVDTTRAVIAVVGFLALLAVASWWMVRRPDPDGRPMPPTDSAPPSDLI
jgi:hypothetical protein